LWKSLTLSDFNEKTFNRLVMLVETPELLLESNNETNFVLIVSKEAFVSIVKSVFTVNALSRLEEIWANLRLRVFKIAAIAGNK
jgi:hypothetical protein